MTVSEEVNAGHQDRVTVLHVNFDGSKILTGSIDHRVKVWNVDRATGTRTLIETFTAHDADIRDAKWLHPSTGTHLATVGNDLKFHLWQEEPHQPPNQGRRFRRIYTIPSKPRVPFVSLDFKNIDSVYTYLALIDRQGLLSVYEPTNPDDFKDWTLIDQFHVCLPHPGRGDQTCFKVRFDQNVIPLPHINCLVNDRRQLSLVVSAMNEVKIYRAIVASIPDGAADVGVGETVGPEGASHRFMFYEAARLPLHPALVRDVQWAPFNVRGTDLFATACKDGAVRIFEMSVTEKQSHGPRAHSSMADDVDTSASQLTKSSVGPHMHQAPQQSSLTTAITSRNKTQSNTSGQTTVVKHLNASTNAAGADQVMHPRATHAFPYTHRVQLMANLHNAHDDAWSVQWDASGHVLMSGGGDGVTKIWRRSILDPSPAGTAAGDTVDIDNGGGGVPATSMSSGSGGRWMLFADQAVDFGGDDSEGSDME